MGGFAPRLGIAYAVTPKTVVRTGYGIFYSQAFHPGWESSIATDALTADATKSVTLGGYGPALILSEGFTGEAAIRPNEVPPAIDSSFRNGADLQYKPFDANRCGYTQQWNLSIKRQFGSNFTLTTAYVGNKGTRLLSHVAPLNVLDPKLLSPYGDALLDEFEDEQTPLHGVSVPYAGWLDQLTCSPTRAQALLPYPQYCSRLEGLNENAGNSTYHSFQLKAEKRFSQGTFLLASYTISKLLTSSDQTQSGEFYDMHWVFSAYGRKRSKALSIDDVPQVLSTAMINELPFGRGKRFLNMGGVVDKLLGGWSISNVFWASSGVPFYFRSGNCNVPEQFRVSCVPGILPGANPWAQGKGTFDPNRSLFNKVAFEPVTAFDSATYYGQGSRISNLRGFGYHTHNFGLIKNTKIAEQVNFQIRAEFFNVWNWHSFNCTTQCFAGLAFDTDIARPEFGMWNGAVTEPRNIQLAARIEF